MVPVNPGLFLKITGTGIIITKKGPGVTDRDPVRLLLLTIVITSLEICKVKSCGTNLFVKIIKEDLFTLGGGGQSITNKPILDTNKTLLSRMLHSIEI